MPTEHGAWGLLAVPFLSSAMVAGGADRTLILAATGLLAIFLLRGSLANQGWNTWRQQAHMSLAGLAALCWTILVLVDHRYQLLAVAACGLGLFAWQFWLIRRHNRHHTEKRSLAAELVGVILLSLSAPTAWIAARGHLNETGALVWGLNVVFFIGGVLYVKYRVRGIQVHRSFATFEERLGFVWPVVVYHLLLAAFLAAWTIHESRAAVIALAFAPAILRANALLLQLGRNFPIKRLGWTEVVHALFFAALIVLGHRG